MLDWMKCVAKGFYALLEDLLMSDFSIAYVKLADNAVEVSLQELPPGDIV